MGKCEIGRVDACVDLVLILSDVGSARGKWEGVLVRIVTSM